MSSSGLFFHPFAQGHLDQKLCEQPALALNVPYALEFEAIQNLVPVHNYKYEFAPWQAKGYTVLPEIPARQAFGVVFCQIPQSKEYSLFLLAQALDALTPGGVLICIAANNQNGKRLKQWLESFGARAQSESKQKHRIVWTYKKDIDEAIIQTYLNKYGTQQVKLDNIEYATKPGIYGWNKIDIGSQILVDNLPKNMKGTGADFGCGYGFLSYQIESERIQELDLIDSDYNALQCAKANLKKARCHINFYFKDICNEKLDKKYDFIIMNPPFHQGKKTDSDIGAQFIEQAAYYLKPKAFLYMVANSFLPYENVLKANFKNVEKICEKNGFKVYFAQK